MVSQSYKITLHRDDLCAILTVDSGCVEIFYESYVQVLKCADMIQEWMIYVMKTEEYREGIWVWRVKKMGNELTGEQILDELDDM